MVNKTCNYVFPTDFEGEFVVQFYVLTRPPIQSDEERAAGTDVHLADGSRLGEARRCDACRKFVGMRPWMPPFRVELETWGCDYGDIAFNDVGADILVSLRLRDLLRNAGLNALSEFDAVDVVKARQHRKLFGDRPSYFKTTIRRSSSARVDHVASKFQWTEKPDICPVCWINKKGGTFLRNLRTIIDPDSWTGEDLFIPRGSNDFVASERFHAFCKSQEIKNACFVPCESYGHDHSRYQSGTDLPPPATVEL